MENSVCCSCQSTKAPLTCGMCQEAVCKKCTEFMDEGAFSFEPNVPAELSHSTYCRLCFDAKVSPALDDYNALKKQAKEVFVFFKDQNKESRLIKRLEDPIYVPECEDRNETLLRLAFLAAKGNFNVLVEVDITSEKKREGAYQKTIWKGSAIPSYVDPRKLTEKNKWSFVRSDGPSYRTPGARR
ncbi:hypothetical protein [Bdellovibrio sp. HCB2-146]|uniref:hypothetical protein n=1 Tax=Bdellovibrio sp. HCB2-146 TaxID=3394362 RepID=UPI0039BCE3BF